MIRESVVAAIALAAAGIAPGQSRAAELGVTLLHLSATGTVQETPDLLVATLVGTASASDPATSQRQLDQRMAEATRIAGAATGIAWKVASYAVDRTEPDPKSTRSVWTASQTLHLQSADSHALLSLVGTLQGKGLTVAALDWTLSPSHLADAQTRASDLALKVLRARAASAAATLGLRVAGIRDVTLGGDDRPRPMPLMKAMLAAAPQATRADAEVSQDVSAEIALTP